MGDGWRMSMAPVKSDMIGLHGEKKPSKGREGPQGCGEVVNMGDVSSRTVGWIEERGRGQ